MVMAKVMAMVMAKRIPDSFGHRFCPTHGLMAACRARPTRGFELDSWLGQNGPAPRIDKF